MKKLMIRILTFAVFALGFIALTIVFGLYWMGILLAILLFVFTSFTDAFGLRCVLVHCTRRSKTDFPMTRKSILYGIAALSFTASGLIWTIRGNIPIGMMNVSIGMTFLTFSLSKKISGGENDTDLKE